MSNTEFKKAFDDVSPDMFMQTRILANIKSKKKRRFPLKAVISAALALVVVVACVGSISYKSMYTDRPFSVMVVDASDDMHVTEEISAGSISLPILNIEYDPQGAWSTNNITGESGYAPSVGVSSQCGLAVSGDDIASVRYECQNDMLTYGYTAKKTLDIAQKLYESRKLLTYPRTDSRCLPPDMAGKMREAIAALPEPYAALKVPLLQKPLPLLKRVFDASRVSDHHALVTTGRRFDPQRLEEAERKVMHLVIRRMLAVFYPDYVYDSVRVVTQCAGELFESTGREVVQPGWKVTQEGMEFTNATKGERKERITQPTEAQMIVMTDAFFVIATHPTDSP